MKLTFVVLASMMSFGAFAKDCRQVIDQRFKMGACGQTKDTVLCFASTKKVATKDKTVLLTQKIGQKTVQTYVLVSQRITRAVGEQAYGLRESTETYVKSDSQNPTISIPGSKKFTLKFHETWEYSAGYTTVKGILPTGLKLEDVFFESKEECGYLNQM